ncbi:MAG: hypothetical protein HYR56_01295 [Acidobacteria bacterium]|nr:hypothetical protein [Acidobacteriota bacterium]MBI3426061.1 hypothetical protein [Acidobacteriota bacterium]
MRLSFSSLSSAACVLLGLSVVSSGFAQTKPAATGVIAGRVMIGEKPAVGVLVGLVRAEPNSPSTGGALAKDATDNDGRYRLAQVAAGNYRVTPLTPAYVSPADSPGFSEQGKTVQMREGEAVENLDFKLIRGGVISGKVTDTSDKPLIEERLTVWKLEAGGRKSSWSAAGTGFYMMMTDDRGVYRLFGLPEGRYLIAAGVTGASNVSLGRGRAYRRTFYPDVTDENQAKPIEVSPGSETKDIDLRLEAESTTGHTVVLRVVEAETGAPLAGQGVMVSALQNERQSGVSSMLYTDANGVARFDQLKPGRYGATLRGGATPSEYFSEMVKYEITDSDVEGLEIRAQRGATLSGKAVIEGNADPTLMAKLVELRLSAYSVPLNRGPGAPPPVQIIPQGTKINPDGSFRVSGIAPGQARFGTSNFGGPASFTLLRVELDGMPQKDGIEVVAGQQVTNVRLLFGYGQASVRGQLEIVGGTLPEGARVFVSARRTDEQNMAGKGATVDARGRFVIEALIPGEYELILTASPRMIVTQGPDGNFGTSNQPTPGLPRSVRQKITVPAVGEVTVSLTLNLAQPEKQQ